MCKASEVDSLEYERIVNIGSFTAHWDVARGGQIEVNMQSPFCSCSWVIWCSILAGYKTFVWRRKEGSYIYNPLWHMKRWASLWKSTQLRNAIQLYSSVCFPNSFKLLVCLLVCHSPESRYRSVQVLYHCVCTVSTSTMSQDPVLIFINIVLKYNLAQCSHNGWQLPRHSCWADQLNTIADDISHADTH